MLIFGKTEETKKKKSFMVQKKRKNKNKIRDANVNNIVISKLI